MKRLVRISILIFLSALSGAILLPSSVWSSEKRGFRISTGRYALVIGIGAYPTSPLKNTVHDSEDMAQLLRQLGFTVMHRQDVGLRDMETAVREFGYMLATGGTGLFYYAGHGMQVEGRNYLIPVDAKIESQSDIRFEALDVGRVLGKMEDAENGLNIVILDACRDNPFARGFRSARSGLARMDAPRGTLIAFATAPGSVAADGHGRNGLYTKHLLLHMTTPNLPVEQVFKNVRIGVLYDSNERQVPWESSSLIGNFYFNAASGTTLPAPNLAAQHIRPGPKGVDQTEILYWESIKDKQDQRLLEAYLQRYPNGAFKQIAEIQLDHLQQTKSGSRPDLPQTAMVKAEAPVGPKFAYAKGERKNAIFILRAIPEKITSESEIKNMVTKYDFFDKDRNPKGRFQNRFGQSNSETVLDLNTGLMWQTTGTHSRKSFSGAKLYVKKLNLEKFAGYSDWRLPTIEELASLIQKTKNHSAHTAAIFTKVKSTYWSSDEAGGIHNYPGESANWVVDFREGQLEKANYFPTKPRGWDGFTKDDRNYVRAVRTAR